MLAAASITLTSCAKNDTVDDSKNKTPDANENVTVAEGQLSFSDALDRLKELEEMTELDKEQLLTVGKVPMSAMSVKYSTVACNTYYSEDGNPDEETKQIIEDEIKSYFALNAAVVNLANENGIGISEENFQTNIADNIDYFKESYGDDYADIIEMYTLMSPYCYFESTLYNVFYSELTDYFYGQNGVAENIEDIKTQVMDTMKEGNYVRAKHILISFPEDIETDEEGNIPEAAKADTLAKANEVLEKVNNGEDFDSLINEYGEDPGMKQNPDGYYFNEGVMVAPFEEATYALNEGDTSDLVETSYGYHIIKRLPISDDNAGFYSSDVYQQAAYDAMSQMLTDESASYEFEYTDGFDERQQAFLDEYLAEQQAAENAEAETDADGNVG